MVFPALRLPSTTIRSRTGGSDFNDDKAGSVGVAGRSVGYWGAGGIPDEGGGGGGGGGSVGRPVAVIRIGAHGIEVKPVLDLTKLGMTLLVSALAAWRGFRR